LVLVACSGGTDSLALAAACAFEAPKQGVRAGAVVVDHGLLADSDQVARRAAAQCERLGLAPVTVQAVAVNPGAEGVEAAARQARYQALEQVAASQGAAAVLLAHTLDDQAETVLLALARGAGATALTGMAERRGRLVRPFLELTRAQTEAAIAAQGLTAWQDPTNLPNGPHPSRRAEVRARLMPVLRQVVGPGAPAAIARTAQRLRQDRDCLDAQGAALFAQAMADAVPPPPAPGPVAKTLAPPAPGPVPKTLAPRAAQPASPPSSEPGERGEAGWTASADGAALELDVEPLAAAHPALRDRALLRAAQAAGADPSALAAAHIQALAALAADWRGQGALHLPGGVRAAREYGKLVFRACANPIHQATTGAAHGR
jgi:tRNA(Ile)-lysidine synthase